MKVGVYDFTQIDIDSGEGTIRFQVIGTGNYSVSKEEEKKIKKILNQMGKWEKMIGSLSHVLGDLGLIQDKREVEEFNIDDYKLYAEFGQQIADFRSYCVYVTIHHKPRSNAPMEMFWKLIPNTILWIQFLETLSIFGLKGD